MPAWVHLLRRSRGVWDGAFCDGDVVGLRMREGKEDVEEEGVSLCLSSLNIDPKMR